MENIYEAAGSPKPLAVQVTEFAGFSYFLAGAAFLVLLGRTVGSAQKDMANYLLEVITPEEVPVRIPQTSRKEKKHA